MKELPEHRSRIMRAIRSEDTSAERIVRSLLHKEGYRFRLHRRDLPGKPDLVFPGWRKAVFVHGCFWHGHDCKRGARVPKTNREYWTKKIGRNVERDVKNKKKLEENGWDVLVVWECELQDAEKLLCRLRSFLGRSAPAN